MATQLKEYRQKRDFKRTPEPSGKPAARPAESRRFVVQKHAARQLHYDLRFELGGVLKSWAVPKGPSPNPAEKRLAIEVEDHPIEYADFEGIIPKGEYGGGTVMVWDHGEWETQSDPQRALKNGKITFQLRGSKLKGEWSLIRSHSRSGEGRGGKQWLLIKHDDKYARDTPGAEWLESRSRSVLSRLTMKSIAGSPERVWSRNGASVQSKARQSKQSTRPRKSSTPPRSAASIEPSSLTNARRAQPPARLAPQLATLADAPPVGDQWLHEIKFDGYRIVGMIRDGKSVLKTRQGKNWTDRFKDVAAALAQLPVQEAVLDGEIVVLDAEGRSQFQLLQNLLNSAQPAHPRYYVFDLPWCEGYDLTRSPLLERKELLRGLLDRSGLPDAGVIRYSDHIIGKGSEVIDRACAMNLEGVISKRVDSPYRSRRTRDWIKSKCTQRQEFIIAGYTAPNRSRLGFGALLLAVHDQSGKLVYCGRVGTGFTEQSLRDLHQQLKALKRADSSIAHTMSTSEQRGVTWVEPRLIAEVAFQEWTGDARLRHPVFHGLREDKPAAAIIRESPEHTPSRRTSSPSSRARKPMNTTLAQSRKDGAGNVVGGVALSNPDRVLYPQQGLTKRQLAEYYDQVAGHLLPHLVDRPLSLVRCPQGSGENCFFQRHFREDMPAPVVGIESDEADGKEKWISVNDREGLISLAQIGVLEIHPWGARKDMLDRPDRLIFDLDPGPGVEWADVIEAAHELHRQLSELELKAFVKTTGGKGLHLVAPLARRSDWETVKSFARAIADRLARREPARYVAKMTKARRQGRIYIDYLRNARSATAVGAYSPRARPGAPVSMPITWKELTPDLDADQFDITTVPDLLRSRSRDPWAGFDHVGQSITASRLRAVV